jgi:hypothetical protein
VDSMVPEIIPEFAHRTSSRSFPLTALLKASVRLCVPGGTSSTYSLSIVPAHLSPAAREDAIRLLDSPAVVIGRGNQRGNTEETVENSREGGVGNGVRTRDFRSHSPALYR